MSADTLDYLGIRLNRMTIDEFIDEIKLCVTQRCKLTASFFAFYTSNIIASNKTVENVFKSLDMLFPDGISIVWTSWLLGEPLGMSKRISGDIWAPYLFSEAVQQGWGIYFLGGAPGVASAAAGKLQKVFPSLQIKGSHHGYLRSGGEKQAVIDDINQSGATIVLVGMGQPTQEKWIVANKNRVCASVLLGIGGYFDHVVRRVDCYPAWVYKCRINWAYRLLKEPKRLGKRYTIGILRFGLRVLWARFKLALQKTEGAQPNKQAPD